MDDDGACYLERAGVGGIMIRGGIRRGFLLGPKCIMFGCLSINLGLRVQVVGLRIFVAPKSNKTPKAAGA